MEAGHRMQEKRRQTEGKGDSVATKKQGRKKGHAVAFSGVQGASELGKWPVLCPLIEAWARTGKYAPTGLPMLGTAALDVAGNLHNNYGLSNEQVAKYLTAQAGPRGDPTRCQPFAGKVGGADTADARGNRDKEAVNETSWKEDGRKERAHQELYS